jgi:tripartite-type tricarboxylate transporter receptor subunit TctC
MTKLLPTLLFVNLALAQALPVSAQTYPAKPVRIVIGFAAGGGADILARTVGPKLGEVLGQSIVIDNRPGAAGHIANEHVAKSAPDGYTLLMGSPGLVTYRSLYVKQTYDPERDLAPVSLVGVVPNLLVLHPSVPAHTVKQLIELARAKPGRFNYASPGVGTSLHLAAELFKALAKVEITQIVYKGGAPAVADLMGGHVDLMFDVLPSSLPHVKSGRLKAIGITIAHRSTLLPEVPTIAESGLPGYQAVTWNGLLAPAATPRDIGEKLAAELAQVLRTPDMKARFAAIGTETASNTPEQFRTFLREETVKWSKVIKDAGIKLE